MWQRLPEESSGCPAFILIVFERTCSANVLVELVPSKLQNMRYSSLGALLISGDPRNHIPKPGTPCNTGAYICFFRERFAAPFGDIQNDMLFRPYRLIALDLIYKTNFRILSAETVGARSSVVT